MTSDSDLSDCEALSTGTKKASDLNPDAPSFTPELNADAAPFVPEVCNPSAEMHTRLRSGAPLFMPVGTTSLCSLAPPPGLRTDLNRQAKAFVPMLMRSW